MSLPYENATSGDKAIGEMQKILRGREEEAAREAAMTPAEKEARRKSRQFLTMTIGLMIGMTSNAGVTSLPRPKGD